jgi:tRNA G18 (ribose-2'-O)-methylase SpoU
MQIIHIETLDLPELEPYRTLRGRTQHWKDDFVVTEGEKAVRALLASKMPVHSLLMNEEWLRVLSAELGDERLASSTVYVASDILMNSIVGFPLHQKLLAIGRLPENLPLSALNETAAGRHVHVALEGLADAENMGMILRNCAAFGVRSVIVGPDSTSPWMRRSVRVSLGNVFSLSVYRSENLFDTLRHCQKEFGWRIIGTTPRGGRNSLQPRTGESEQLCLFFGSEASGLSDEALALCDALFTIPMRGGVDSINVANAVAVSLYKATRHGTLE